jgi:NAD(P)-dependent dehydrogenase (short-subunit alcohol dehydrogenase family)
MDLFSLDGKVALVTGAGLGLGRQFSEVMAQAGADVACADINQESARAAAAVVQGLGRRSTALCPGFYQTNLSRGAIDDPQVRATITAFIPMGRIAQAAEIKGRALFLASAASDYMTDQTLVTDGGCLAK